MKKTVQNFVSARKNVLERAEEIFEVYSKHFLHGDEHIVHVTVDGDAMVIMWEVTWAYGGHDEGSIEVPIIYFQDDWQLWIDSLILAGDKKQKMEKKKAIAAKRKKEKATLKRLLKKYGS